MAIGQDYDVEIDDEVKYTRTVGERTFYYQLAYLNKGKRNDVEFAIPLGQAQLPFRAGRYKFSGRNPLFSVNQYNSLEIDRDFLYAAMEFPIVPVAAAAPSVDSAAAAPSVDSAPIVPPAPASLSFGKNGLKSQAAAA